MTDRATERCLIRIAQGEREVLRTVYELYGRAVYALAYAVLRDAALAEDVSQEVFLKILHRADTYRIGGNPKAWIMGITRNMAIDALRQRKHVQFTDTVPDDGQISMDNRTLESAVVGRLDMEQALSVLDGVQREIIIMHVVAGLRYREIAAVLGLPMGTVSSKYNSAVKKLRGQLG